MRSVKRKLKEALNCNILDIGECNLLKVYNAFGTGLSAFGADVELLVIDIYYYFKHAVRSTRLVDQQKDLGIPEHVFLRHVNNRWLTFQSSLERVLEQFEVLKRPALRMKWELGLLCCTPKTDGSSTRTQDHISKDVILA